MRDFCLLFTIWIVNALTVVFANEGTKSSLGLYQVGPFQFEKIKLSNTYPLHELSKNYGYDHNSENIIYAQIVNPTNDIQHKLNDYISENVSRSEQSTCDGKRGNTDVELTIQYASEEVITYTEIWSLYCIGAAHGFSYDTTVTLLLEDDIRILEIDELINFDQDWREPIFQLAMKYIATTSRTTEIDADVMAFIQWRLRPSFFDEEEYFPLRGANITPEGVKIHFGETLGYARGQFYAVIPWEEMKPFLINGVAVPFK